jgi:hypothetical protein
LWDFGGSSRERAGVVDHRGATAASFSSGRADVRCARTTDLGLLRHAGSRALPAPPKARHLPVVRRSRSTAGRTLVASRLRPPRSPRLSRATARSCARGRARRAEVDPPDFGSRAPSDVGSRRERTRARVPHTTGPEARFVGLRRFAARAGRRRSPSGRDDGVVRLRGVPTFAARGRPTSVCCGTRARVRSRRRRRRGTCLSFGGRDQLPAERRSRGDLVPRKVRGFRAQLRAVAREVTRGEPRSIRPTSGHARRPTSGRAGNAREPACRTRLAPRRALWDFGGSSRERAGVVDHRGATAASFSSGRDDVRCARTIDLGLLRHAGSRALPAPPKARHLPVVRRSRSTAGRTLVASRLRPPRSPRLSRATARSCARGRARRAEVDPPDFGSRAPSDVGSRRERTRARVPHTTGPEARFVGLRRFAARAGRRRSPSGRDDGVVRLRGVTTFASRGRPTSVCCGTRARVRSRRRRRRGTCLSFGGRDQLPAERRSRGDLVPRKVRGLRAQLRAVAREVARGEPRSIRPTSGRARRPTSGRAGSAREPACRTRLAPRCALWAFGGSSRERTGVVHGRGATTASFAFGG